MSKSNKHSGSSAEAVNIPKQSWSPKSAASYAPDTPVPENMQLGMNGTFLHFIFLFHVRLFFQINMSMLSNFHLKNIISNFF